MREQMQQLFAESETSDLSKTGSLRLVEQINQIIRKRLPPRAPSKVD
jgi:hypothetical protein